MHHAATTLEVYEACVIHPYEINYEEDLQICKKRDPTTNECSKMDPITDRDVKRLEVYTFTISCLYYTALFLPVLVPSMYQAHALYKEKDVKNKFDERTFAATQILTVGVTLYVCLMPFVLAVHSEIVGKTIYE